jgi:hypothetical protein
MQVLEEWIPTGWIHGRQRTSGRVPFDGVLQIVPLPCQLTRSQLSHLQIDPKFGMTNLDLRLHRTARLDHDVVMAQQSLLLGLVMAVHRLESFEVGHRLIVPLSMDHSRHFPRIRVAEMFQQSTFAIIHQLRPPLWVIQKCHNSSHRI